MRKGPARRRHTESAPKAGAPGSLTSPPQAGTWRSQSPEAREAGGPAQHVEGRARGRDAGAREPLQHGRMGKASRPVSGRWVKTGTQGECVGHPGARCEAPARNLPGGRCCGRQRAARSRAHRRWRPLRPHAAPNLVPASFPSPFPHMPPRAATAPASPACLLPGGARGP